MTCGSLGVVPAVGSGLASMARTGQLGRLARHLEGYRETFQEVRYFSWLPPGEDGPHALPGCQLVCEGRPRSGAARAWLRPLREPLLWSDLSLVRAMNLLGAVPALMARWAYGVPFVLSHGADYEAIARIHGAPRRHVAKWRWLARLALPRAERVFVSNPALARRLQARHPGAHIVHLPNWVDLERFRPDGPLPDGGPILYVGRLVAEKDLIRLGTIAWTERRWKVRMVGEGPLQAALGRLRVETPGAIPWEQLPEEYRRAAVFCLPSLTEGNPKALLEAMACGAPAVASGAVEGVVRDGETGLLFAPGDQRGLLGALRRLFADRGLARQLGEAGARWVAEHHDRARLLPREVQLLREVAR